MCIVSIHYKYYHNLINFRMNKFIMEHDKILQAIIETLYKCGWLFQK